MKPEKKNIYSVAQINSYIREMISQDFLLNGLMIRGEVSNLTDHASGHLYFTLKDEKAAISCVMFAGNRRGLRFPLREGMQVVASGDVDVYEKAGRYQLYVKELVRDGEGLLALRFEKLKAELEERGMFAQEYKRPIPSYVKTLGVVTAPTGAAVRDIIQIAKRRNPGIQIILYPALVQGEGAAESIVRGIRTLEALSPDVIIAGRGGGSLEDLWAFNEEIVAEAFFQCSVPIISAVGHETDVVLSDFVADLRAPTPSAAAELAVCDVMELLARLNGERERIKAQMEGHLVRARLRIENLALRLKSREPVRRLREHRNALIYAEERLHMMMKSRLERERNRLAAFSAERLGLKMNARLEKDRHRFALYLERLKALSPLERLSGGFVYARNERGEGLRTLSQVSEGEQIELLLKDGRLKAKITEKSPESRLYAAGAQETN